MPEVSCRGNTGGERPRVSAEALALPLVLLCYVVWMLSLPCFPTTDGPVHMYYTHVLGSLLFHTDPVYAQYFRIRHLLPPYALYYYALLGLSHVVPMLLADRLIICAYFISFAFGFRFLARTLGPSADRMTLLATLLLVNWPLGMGFVNFCLSLSFSLWGIGIWLRLLGRRTVWGRAGFLLLVTVIMFTHPVPLLLLLCVTGALLLVRLVQGRRAAGGAWPQQAGADGLTWMLATSNLGYVKLFATADPLQKVASPSNYWRGIAERIHDYARERAIAVLNGARWDLYGYRFALGLLLVIALGLAVQQRLRNRRAGVWTPGDTLFFLGLMLLLGLPLFPSQLNGLYYFADRLMICIWITFLLAASGWGVRGATGTGLVGSPGSFSRTGPAALVSVAFTLAANFALLHGLDTLTRPSARILASLGEGSRVPAGVQALVVEDGRPATLTAHENLTWDPFYWAGVHILREHDDVLANAPWMKESIIPITDTGALAQVRLPVLQPPYPNRLAKSLLASPAQLAETLRLVDYLVVNQAARAPLRGPGPLLQSPGVSAAAWSCETIADGDFRICRRQTAER